MKGKRHGEFLIEGAFGLHTRRVNYWYGKLEEDRRSHGQDLKTFITGFLLTKKHRFN